MARQRTLYKLVGRYMNGNDTVYYALISEDNREVRATEEQMAFYVGREQVINVKAQLYKDKVLFRGIDCDIKNLPIIQLDTNNNTKTTSNTLPKNKDNTPKNENTIIHKIYELLNNINTETYGRIPEYSKLNMQLSDKLYIQQQIKDKNNVVTRQYIIENINDTVYFRQNEYFDKYIIKFNSINDNIMSIIYGIFGYINKKCFYGIFSAEDCDEDNIRAFNAYTGASNYFNDIQRGLGTKYVDMTSIGETTVQIVRMLRVYNKLKQKDKKIPFHLFRGGYLPNKGYIDGGFLSYSYSFNMASSFASNNQAILITSNLSTSMAINTEDIAVCIENGEPSEREITLKPYLLCLNTKQIGYYDQHPLCLIEYSNNISYEQEIDTLIYSLSTLENSMQAYLLTEILKRDKNVEILGNEYGELTIYGKMNYVVLYHNATDTFYNAEIDGKVIVCDTKEKCNDIINKMYNKVTNKTLLSDEFIDNLREALSIPDPDFCDVSKTYEDVVNHLLKKYSNLAYKLEETLDFEDMAECMMQIVKSENNIYYIAVNKWESSELVYLAVSKSTFDLISAEYPDRILNSTVNCSDQQFTYCHYHELVIRMALFSRIPQYKKLKMQFMRYNKEIFDNKITPKIIMMVGEYKDGTHFDDLEGCAGYSRSGNYSYNGFPLIIMKYEHFKSVDNIDNLSRDNLCTLLHEMSHAYADEIYGSGVEKDPNKWGDVLYGIDKEKHPIQYKHHDKNFGDTIKMVSQKTGFSFDELFRYGVKIDSTKRDTIYTTNLGYNAIKHSELPDVIYTENKSHSIGDAIYYSSRYRKAFENIKNTIVKNQDSFRSYFDKKFNMQIKFNITPDETRVCTVDSFGITRFYDINFDTRRNMSVILYRMFNDTDSSMLHIESVKSTPNSVIKNILQKIYIDTVNN